LTLGAELRHCYRHDLRFEINIQIGLFLHG
jgi:hypothetical protein